MIKLIKSTFHKEAETKRKLVDFILNADVLSMGEQTALFEKKFAKKQGRKFAIFVNSGSTANFVLLQALLNIGRLKKGDKVGISAVTWSTNVMPIIQLGMVPVPIDCELDTLNVSSRTLKEHITEIDAFFLTNALGWSADIANIRNMCEDENIIFLEDNCESLGSVVGGVRLGNFGLASTFSFFVGHHLSTIEGGMIATDDEELYDMLNIARAHGWGRNLSKEKQKKYQKEDDIDDFYARYTFYDLGNTVRPTEIQSFIGNIQLDYWDEVVGKREKNYSTLKPLIDRNRKFQAQTIEHLDVFSNFAVPLIGRTKEIFEEYKKKFEQSDVEIRPIIAGNITKQPFYRKYQGDSYPLPNADIIGECGFYFGNNPELTSKELEILASLLD